MGVPLDPIAAGKLKRARARTQLPATSFQWGVISYRTPPGADLPWAEWRFPRQGPDPCRGEQDR